MNRKKIICGLLLLLSQASFGQVTDPMITKWWFNTTGATYRGILTDVDAVYYNTTNVYVKSSGVPDYYLDGVSHNNASDLHATWVIPRVPQVAATPMGIMGGQQGLMLDGSVFFHPGDARSYSNAGVWNQLAYYFEGVDMDVSNGHSTPTNMYHHHFDNLKLHGWDSTQHSPIVGYAWDGYPVYGPSGYKNTDGTGGIKRMQSSYSPKSYTTRTSGPAVSTTYPIGCYIEDWQYTAGSGDLDAHNGRTCKTPEYPSGTYAYFTTVDANLKPYYPYFIGPTFYGVLASGNVGPTGGQNTLPSDTTRYIPTTTAASDIAKIESNITLYPIPVTENLTIQLTENNTYTVVLYNLNGEILEDKVITTTAKIDMGKLPYGVYFVEVTDKATNSGFIKRIVKQ
jgi:hypothetical protein